MKNFRRDCFIASLLAMTIFLAACGKSNQEPSPLNPQLSMTQERVSFQTTDGVTIIGDWTVHSNAKNAALLLHMMPATRVSWAPLVDALNKAGFATLAIDLRGHGESTKRKLPPPGNTESLDYKNFSDSEHQASRLDIDAAFNFLKQKGFDESAIALVGASVGANLSLDALYRYNSTSRAVLLSPGLDYRGVKTESPMRQLGPHQKVWIIAAEGDQYSANSSITLQQLQKQTGTVTIFGGSDHGTTLFSSQPSLIRDIVKFLGP
ncbi:alpha/beta fold hydrolase [Candidatus Peregrinibacteria bacterium]|nr:alpha/beta fold hydrolase [Candidatus Peregrinibacteria bacterium]